MSGSCLMGDVSRQYLFIGETGSDTGGVGCISAAIVAHVDNQSVTYRQIGEHFVQITVTDRVGETFVPYVADIIFQYLVFKACCRAIIRTGASQIGIFQQVCTEVAGIVLIPGVV